MPADTTIEAASANQRPRPLANGPLPTHCTLLSHSTRRGNLVVRVCRVRTDGASPRSVEAKHRAPVWLSSSQASGPGAGSGATAVVGPGGVNGTDGKWDDEVGRPAGGAVGAGTSAAQLACS